MAYLTTSAISLGADTSEGEAARRSFFSDSSYDGGWYEDFCDHIKDQPLGEDGILGAIESTLLDIAEIPYVREGLIDSAYKYSVKNQSTRQGIATWAHYTAMDVVRGIYSSVSEIEDEIDADAKADAERARELDFLASEQ